MSTASLTTVAATTIPPRTGTAGDVTSFIPLTKAFKANTVCGDVFVSYSGNSHGLMGWDPSYGDKVDSLYKCNPPIVSRWFTQERNGDIQAGQTGISIGPFSCPSGWNTLASVVRFSSSTLAECCPPLYSLSGNSSGEVDGNCVMAVTSGQTLIYASPTSSSQFGTFTTTLSSHSTVGAIAIKGWNVNYVQSVATSTSTSSDNTTSDTTSTSSSVISGGAIAGIVVGVIAGVSLLAMMLFILIRRRRKQHQKIAPEAGSTQAVQDQQAELHGQDLPHETEAHEVAELPTEHERRYELDGQQEEKND